MRDPGAHELGQQRGSNRGLGSDLHVETLKIPPNGMRFVLAGLEQIQVRIILACTRVERKEMVFEGDSCCKWTLEDKCIPTG